MTAQLVAKAVDSGAPSRQTSFDNRSSLCVYDLFAEVESLVIRVPTRALGFIPFSVKKEFGFFVVLTIAAFTSRDMGLLLSLAKAALAAEFAPVTRTAPELWSIRPVSVRECGVAPAMCRQPGCLNRNWGATWYERGDAIAKRDAFELAKKRLWDEGFKVPIPAVPRRVVKAAENQVPG